jgi:multiple sugar transport system permease protein
VATQLRPAANVTAQRQPGGDDAADIAISAARRRPPLGSATRFGGYAYVGPAILYLLLLSIYPLTYTVQLSTTDVRAGEQFFVGFAHYVALTQDPWFWNSAKVDLIFSVGSTILHLGLGFAFATLLNQAWPSLWLRNVFRGLLILPWVFSTAAAGLMWTLLYHPFGILNYFWLAVLKQSDPLEFLAQPGMALVSLTIVNTWKAYPIYMIFILGGLQAIPHELYEAAKVDGATPWQRFISVTVPQLRTVLLAISSLDFVTTMGHVDLIRLLTRGGPLQSTETTPFYIFKTALIDGNLGYGAAVATLLMLALAIFTVFYLRMLSRGAESDGTSF